MHDPREVQIEVPIAEDLRERRELRRGHEGRRDPFADPEQRSEGGDARRLDGERDRGIGRSFGGGVHRRRFLRLLSPPWGTTEMAPEPTRNAAYTGLPSAPWPAPDRTATRSRCTIPSP